MSADLICFEVAVKAMDAEGDILSALVAESPARFTGVITDFQPMYRRDKPVRLRLCCDAADIGKHDKDANTSNIWTIFARNVDARSGPIFDASLKIDITTEHSVKFSITSGTVHV